MRRFGFKFLQLAISGIASIAITTKVLAAPTVTVLVGGKVIMLLIQFHQLHTIRLRLYSNRNLGGEIHQKLSNLRQR